MIWLWEESDKLAFADFVGPVAGAAWGRLAKGAAFPKRRFVSLGENDLLVPAVLCYSLRCPGV